MYPEQLPDCEVRGCYVRWWVGMGVPSLALIVGMFVAAGTVFARDLPCESEFVVSASDVVVCGTR